MNNVIDRQDRKWWQEKNETTLRRDIFDALIALKTAVENQGRPGITLSHLSTYRQRQLTAVQTTRVAEWEFGYKVAPLDESQGFYRRTLFIKLHGGLLSEINKNERRQIIDAITGAVLDQGSGVETEFINATTFAIHQNFAVMFWHEGNPNIVTPSKELILKSFEIPKPQVVGGGE